MTEQSNPAALRTAIKNRAPEVAITTANRFESASITERLDRLATAIREERYDDAEVQFRKLVEEYETDRAETRRQVEAARAAQLPDGVSLDEQQTLAEYTRTVTATQVKRAQLMAQVGELVSDPEASEQSPIAVADMIEETKTQETTREDRQSSAQSIRDTVSLPATLAVLTFSVTPEQPTAGETVTVSVDLVNVGDEPATDVRATVTTSAGTTVQLIYDELQPGATGNNEVELRPTETGTQTVSVEATGAETDTVSRNETLLIASPGPGILPGQDAPATDPDGDGIYEDVTGNNRFEFLDVLALLFELDRIDPPDTDFVDVNDDGTVNFLDVVELLFELG